MSDSVEQQVVSTEAVPSSKNTTVTESENALLDPTAQQLPGSENNTTVTESDNALLEPTEPLPGIESTTTVTERDNALLEEPTVQPPDSEKAPTVTECDNALLEPAVQLSTGESVEQSEDNFFPFDSLSVEMNVEDQEENDAKTQENVSIVHLKLPTNDSSEVQSPVNTQNMYTSEEIYNAANAVEDSTIPDSNKSLEENDAYVEDVSIKVEPFDPQELQKTNLEDFIYSGSHTNYDEESNSTTEELKEEGRKYPLYRFPKVVKSVQLAEYETLQILYQLLYQRSAWDTQEILKQRILEFSGFNFSNNSEEYFNRDMMLRTQPDEVLIKIGNVLGLNEIRFMYIGGDKARQDLIASIMNFLTQMKSSSKPRKRASTVKADKDDSVTQILDEESIQTKCGCKSRCLVKVSKAQRRALLEYLKELEKKKLLDSYLFNLMRVTRRSDENRKGREVAYQYMVRLGPKEFKVCKSGFASFHGIKQRKLLNMQTQLKSGENLPPKLDMSDFPEFKPPETVRKASPRKPSTETKENKSEKVVSNFQPVPIPEIIMRRIVWDKSDMVSSLNAVTSGKYGTGSASRIFNVPRSTLKRYVVEMKEMGTISAEEFIDLKLGIKKPTLTHVEEQSNTSDSEKQNSVKKDIKKDEDEENDALDTAEQAKPEKVKLRDFPLVVTAIENASTELLIDVHFILFLNSADESEVKENILNFNGFSFDSDTEEYDERNEFLQRMSFKIVGDVARSFSLEILSNKELTIKNILKFLEKPDESYLKATSSMPLSLSDVELDDIEGFSDSDESITCEVVEKKVECIDLLSSGEESDQDKPKKIKTPKKDVAPPAVVKPAQSNSILITPKPTQPVITYPQNVTEAAPKSTASDSQTNGQSSEPRCLRNFETICKIVNTHPHEYLIDIFDLLYLKKHEPSTLRKDILDFTGFTFEKGSADYVKRKQLLDRMLYNSVRRIYNTLIHNTTEVKVFSKPTMITEIFQFLFKLPDHDTSVRPPPPTKPSIKPNLLSTVKAAPTGAVPPPGVPLPNQTGKLSDLKRVFQRVACFPCEYLIDVHKLLFMTDCDAKVIRQNIFAFKGFKFGPESQEFQQRKMYLEYLTFHSLRKISSVLTTRSVDLRNSTKHELASHLTQVLAEYCNTCTETDPPQIHVTSSQNSQTTATVTSSSDSTSSSVETIVVTPTIDPSLANPPIETSVSSSAIYNTNLAQASLQSSQTQQAPPLAISIVDTRSISSPAVTTTSKRKRKSTTVSKIISEKKSQPETNQFADINLPEVEKYRQIYGQNLNIYNPNLPTITGITTISAAGVPQTFPMAQAVNFPIVQVQPSQVIGLPVISQVQSKQSEVIVPGECATNEDENLAKKQKIRDAINGDDDEDCDKPLSSLIGHPIDSVLKKNIVDIVESTDLQDITINGVIQKVYNMYPKFDLSYRKEFIKSTLRAMLYKLGEQKNCNIKNLSRDTDSPDCSVTTSDVKDNSLDESPETTMECS